MDGPTTDEDRPVVGRCLVLHPFIKSKNAVTRSADSRLAEAVGLSEAIELEIVGAEVVPIAKVRPGTLFGSGAVERIDDTVRDQDIDVAVIDGSLTPVQQRNLERAWHCKVIDRTGLILEIFGARARTREGRLQVELAALSYQRSRLVRSWTHLERQRGGFGFLGGPGETQIESDRRVIDDRISRIKRDLTDVRRTRELHRAARRRVPYPIVALVGYTNAGKSTLFNRLTNASVSSKDQLFATLDPTMRAVHLPAGRDVILSDTVGFISELPHELVEAFRATLEEVLEADILLHVRDVAHSDAEAQREDVIAVLRDLGIDEESDVILVEVLNKIDLLNDEMRGRMANLSARGNMPTVALSAVSGEGCERLLEIIDDHLSARRQEISLLVPWSDGALLAWLYETGVVLERSDLAEAVRLRVSLDPSDVARLEQRRGNGEFGGAVNH